MIPQAGRGYIGTCGGSFLGLQHVGFYLPANHTPCGDPNKAHCTPITQEPWDRYQQAICHRL